VPEDATVVKVEQRVYRSDIDDPKTNPSRREVAIPPRTAELLFQRMNSAVCGYRKFHGPGGSITSTHLLNNVISRFNSSGWFN
jgi:hypothetical protein